MKLEDLVLIHQDLTQVRLFIGYILPESIQPEELKAFEEVQIILEKIIKVMKRNAIAHQFQ